MHGVHGPDFDADPLQRKNGRTIPNVPVRHAGLNGQNRHAMVIGRSAFAVHRSAFLLTGEIIGGGMTDVEFRMKISRALGLVRYWG